MDQRPYRGRFAPSPSGRMHLGNLFAALLAWLDVRARGGELLLRMEDLDPERCRPEYASQLAEDLLWLGLDWDLGWQRGAAEYQQSCRTKYYAAAAQTLKRKGLLYPCYCNRKERLAASAPHAADGTVLYSGRCRSLTAEERDAYELAGRRPALRIRVPHERVSFQDDNFGLNSQWLDESCGDFILRRSDGVYAYQLAVTVDDGEMGVTRVVRGSDLLSSTPRQIWLAKQLGYTPPSYTHTPLLLDSAGRRLSKRERDLDMGALRQTTSPERLVGFLAYIAGLTDRLEVLPAKELISAFAWEKVGIGDRAMGESLPTKQRG